MLSVLQDSQTELRAVVLAMKAADREIKRDINRRTRETMNPVWKSLVEGELAGTGTLTTRLLGSGVRIAAGNPPQAMAAQSRRAIGRRKNLKPVTDYHLAEFGVADPEAWSHYERKNRKSPGVHKVKRRASRGLPARVQNGRVVYPAFAEIAPRVVSLWVQTVVRTYYDAVERRR